MSNEQTQDNYVIDSFDLNDQAIAPWDGTGGGPPDVPPGDYLFELVKCESVPTKANDGRNLACVFKIAEGDYAGKEIREWYYHAGPKLADGNKKRIVAVFREALRVPTAPNGSWQTKDAIGLKMWGNVVHEKTTKKGAYDAATQTYAPDKVYENAHIQQERAVEGAAPAVQQQAAPPPPPRPTPPPPQNGAANRTPPPPPPRR